MNTIKNAVLPFPIAALNHALVAFVVALPTMVILYRWLM